MHQGEACFGSRLTQDGGYSLASPIAPIADRPAAPKTAIGAIPHHTAAHSDIGGLGGVIIGAAGGGLGGVLASTGIGAAGGVLMTKGNDIKLQPGTILRIRFEREMTIPVFETEQRTSREEQKKS